MSLKIINFISKLTLNDTLKRINVLNCCASFTNRNYLFQSSSAFQKGINDNGKHFYSSVFTSVPASELWKGVLGVSNAGRKKGRGKRVGRKKSTDLNKGQYIGSGYQNMIWPGLNSSVIKGRELVPIQILPPDPEKRAEMIRLRDQMSKFKQVSLPPLLRGYSGKKFAGQSVGPPDPIADYTFDNFDTKVLEFKMVCNMTGTLGRKMRYSAFVVTGNKNGLAGYALGKAMTGKAAIRVAKNKAAQKLMYIPRFTDNTVFHNMFSQFYRSKIFIHKKGEGYGLRCHRVIKTICEMLGIKDLHCKVENSTTNVQNITKAFFNALMHQETHTELADRLGYHVVERRKEKDFYPTVIASPSHGKVQTQPIRDDIEDPEVSFDRLYYGGRCELQRPVKRWHYENQPSWKQKQKEVQARKNQPDAQILRWAGIG